MREELLPLLILGAGGHTKVLLEALLQEQREIIGIVAPHLDSGTDFLGVTVHGSDEAVFEYDTKEVLLINGVGSIPGKEHRWDLSVKMRERGYQFGRVIHPNSSIATNVLFAEGVQLMAGTIIQPGCKIGQDSIINTGTHIDHDTIIGDQCHIACGVTLSGEVKIGENVHIGSGANVIEGITIGKGCVVAAGTTVYKDVPSGVMVRQQAKMVMEVVKN